MDRPPANRTKRLLKVTAGNLSQNHLYVDKIYDFLPADCIGASRKSTNGNARPIEIVLDGLNETIETDIGVDAKTGKPRKFFRERACFGRFFRHPRIGAIERIDRPSHNIRSTQAKERRQCPRT